MISPVVSLEWVEDHRTDVVLADVRWYLDGRSDRAAYDFGHFPGAVFVDLDACLAGPGSSRDGRNPLPDPDVFADGMAQLGIGNDDTVVAYDDAGGVIAARLVWMLRVTGHDAALLDGGLTAYTGHLETAPTERPRACFDATPWPRNRLVDLHELGAHADSVIIDARNRDRYEGQHEPIDPRPGHIPGAVNLPCREHLRADGRFLPADELRDRFVRAGVSHDTEVVSYCGSGITACHNLLALELAGFDHGRLYPGSWSQYSHAAHMPVAIGSSPV